MGEFVDEFTSRNDGRNADLPYGVNVKEVCEGNLEHNDTLLFKMAISSTRIKRKCWPDMRS
jgi:hypothetical protein